MTPNHLAVILLFFGLIQAFSTTDVNAQSKADKLRVIERERLRALVDADIPTASRLHADDFELIYPQGGTLSREQYLQRIASGDLNYLEWEPEEFASGCTANRPLSVIKRTCEFPLRAARDAPSVSGIQTFTKSEKANGRSFGPTPLRSLTENQRQLRNK